MKPKNVSIPILFFSILIGLLSVIRVFVANGDSTEGDKLTKVLEKISEIELNNQLLSQKVASSSALFALSQKAQEFGYTQQTEFVTLMGPLPLAQSTDMAL